MPHDVFVSYAREDSHLADEVVRKLGAETIEAWSDQRLASGDFFADRLNEALQRSRAVICLWSKASVRSEWVKAEALIGFERKILVPIRVEECHLAVPFNGLHTADFSGWNKDTDHPEWRALIEQLGRLLGRPALREWAQRTHPTALQDLAEVARRYPNDPIAQKASALAHHQFGVDLARFHFEPSDKSSMAGADIDPSPSVRSAYDAKRDLLEAMEAEEREEELQELRWALGVAHRTRLLLENLKTLFPRWRIEFHEKGTTFWGSDLKNLTGAGPANPTEDELTRAYYKLYQEDEEGHPCHHHFVEAGAFIEQSEILLSRGGFSAIAFFREKSDYVFVDMDRESPLQSELPETIWSEIECFDPPSYGEYLSARGGPIGYYERVSFLRSWIDERFAEWCAVRSIDPEQVETSPPELQSLKTGEPDMKKPPASRLVSSRELWQAIFAVLAMGLIFWALTLFR